MTPADLLKTMGVALVAAGVAYGATPLAGRLAGILKMVDRPSARKIHASAIPYLGGLGILAGWMVVFLRPDNGRQSVGLLVGMAILTVTGFVDDRYDISPRVRLGIQILVAAGMIVSGVQITVFEKLGVPGALVADPFVTMVWIVGMTNAFNFMDNMDGAAAGVGGIAAASFGILGLMFGQQLVSVMGFALAGAFLGFLRHNFHPARIFMGDTGSLPLGFCLSILAIKVQFPGVHPVVALSVPLVVLGLFIVDTTVMAVGRILRGEPLIGARLDHLSHRLLNQDLRVTDVAFRLYAVAAGLGVAGIITSQAPPQVAWTMIASVTVAWTFMVISALRWPILPHRPMAAPHAEAEVAAA